MLRTVCTVGIVSSCLASSNAAVLIDGQAIDPALSVGSGANQTVLVIDPNLTTDASRTVYVEYHWDGTKTAADMLNDIVGDSTRLAVLWHPRFPDSGLFGLGFDADGDGLDITPGIPEDAAGGFDGSENGVTNDPQDFYFEGWFTNGFWSHWESGNAGDTWTSAFGVGSVTLADGIYQGLSWAPNFAGTQPTVIPEPASLALLGIVGACVLRRRAR